MNQEEFTEKYREIAILVIAVIAWGFIVLSVVIVTDYIGPLFSAFFVKDTMVVLMFIGALLGIDRIYKLAFALPDQEAI